ncbi:MAG TPA: hypothetical protein VJA23_00295 [Candidatus Nanoarchaeia archaeon]|nr:hypothetical protein [Candidatus Nanoarchaeia archaeon]
MAIIEENKLEKKIAPKSDQEELLNRVIKRSDLKEEPIASKKVAEDDDDDDDDDFGDEEEKDIFSVTYAVGEEQFLAENFYSSNSRNIFTYTFKGNTAPADVYEGEIPIMSAKNNSETMDNVEAKEMLVSVQYAKVLGAMTEINSDERKKFANWVMFNPALWKLFHRNYSVTEDVDYSKTF